MKKLVKIIIGLMFLTVINVNASEISCRYKISVTKNDYTDAATDYITFYFVPGEGIVDKFYVDSVKTEYKFNNALGYPDAKVFGEYNLYMGTKKEFGYVFDNTIKVCPSSLPYIGFGTGTIFYDGFLFMNVNYYSSEFVNATIGNMALDQPAAKETPGKCYCCGGSQGCNYKWIADGETVGANCGLVNDKTKETCTGRNGVPQIDYSKKYCGEAYVIPMNSYLNASNSENLALKVRYYTENEKKYIEITTKKFDKDYETKVHELDPEVGNILDIYYYKDTYGALPIRVETFGKCDNIQIKTCMVYDSNNRLFVGTSCSDDNGDPDTEIQAETEKEYIENYATNFDLNLPELDFGPNGDICKDILGPNLSVLVKAFMKIIRILGAIAAVVNGMLSLIPALISKDADALKKAQKKCITMGIILAIIGIFPSLLSFLGKILKYDISCIF